MDHFYWKFLECRKMIHIPSTSVVLIQEQLECWPAWPLVSHGLSSCLRTCTDQMDKTEAYYAVQQSYTHWGLYSQIHSFAEIFQNFQYKKQKKQTTHKALYIDLDLVFFVEMTLILESLWYDTMPCSNLHHTNILGSYFLQSIYRFSEGTKYYFSGQKLPQQTVDGCSLSVYGQCCRCVTAVCCICWLQFCRKNIDHHNLEKQGTINGRHLRYSFISSSCPKIYFRNKSRINRHLLC